MAEEQQEELQALVALYGEEDCEVVSVRPAHARIHLRPRTADDASQQFVEILVAIKATEQYPAVSPAVEIKQAKGLDDARQRELLSVIELQASSLLHCPMLVTLAEAAVEFLTNNNYPEGDCCFCLLPLMEEEPSTTSTETLSITKLASCFHCFHSDCIAAWCGWTFRDGTTCTMAGGLACPICRAAIDDKDIAQVKQHRVAAEAVQQDTLVLKALLELDAQRQNQYARTLQEQRARGGIIEKLQVLLPGMVLPSSAAAREDALMSTSSVEAGAPAALAGEAGAPAALAGAAGAPASPGAPHRQQAQSFKSRRRRHVKKIWPRKDSID